MAMFDYAMILASIVIGLAITHLMQGLAGIIQQQNRIRIWWVHLVWVAFMLLTAVAWWWWEYALHSVIRWTFQMYLFVLLYAFGVYLTSALLFPRETDECLSYENYFLTHRKWFFGLQIALQLIDLVDTLLKGWNHFRSLGLEYPVSEGAFIIMAIIGIATPDKRVQAAIAVIWLLYQISWLPRLFLLMQ